MIKEIVKINNFVEVISCKTKSVHTNVLKAQPKYYEHIGEKGHVLKDELEINSSDDGCIHWVEKEKKFSFVKIPRKESILKGAIKKQYALVKKFDKMQDKLIGSKRGISK